MLPRTSGILGRELMVGPALETVTKQPESSASTYQILICEQYQWRCRDVGRESNVETSRQDIKSQKILCPSRREAEKYSPFLQARYFKHIYLIFITKSCRVGIFITILQQRN